MWKMEDWNPPDQDSKLSNCYVFKSRLQEYAQKVGYTTPVYETLKDGPSHQPSFRSTVIVNGNRYDSLNGFLNRKAAEQSAAEIALTELAKSGELKQSISMPVHETGLCKNLLQEYAQKMNYAIPTYDCQGVTGNFSCTVEIGGTRYIGAVAKSKKEAEIKAARTALLALQSCSTRLDERMNDNSPYTVIPVKRKGPEKPVANGTMDSPKKRKKARFDKKSFRTRRNENRGNRTLIQNVAALGSSGTPLVAEQQATVGALACSITPLLAEQQRIVGALDSSGTPLVAEQQTIGSLDSSVTSLVAEHQSTVPRSQSSYEVQVGNAGDSGDNACHEVPLGQLENWVFDAILPDKPQVEITCLLNNKVQNQFDSSQSEIRVDVQLFDQSLPETTSIIVDAAPYHVDSIQKEESVALDSSGTPLLVKHQSTSPISQLSRKVQAENTGVSGDIAGHEVLSGQLENGLSDVVLADQLQVESTSLLDNNVLCQFGSIQSDRRAFDVQIPDQAQAETTSVADGTPAAYHFDSIQKESVALDCSGTPLLVEPQSTSRHSQLSPGVQVDNTGNSGNNAGHEVLSEQLENPVSVVVLADQIQGESTSLVDNEVLCDFGSSQLESGVSDVRLFYQMQAESIRVVGVIASYQVASIQRENSIPVSVENAGAPYSCYGDPISSVLQSNISEAGLTPEVQIEYPSVLGNYASHEVLSEQLEDRVSDIVHVVLADQMQVESTEFSDDNVHCQFGSIQPERRVPEFQLPDHVQETTCVADGPPAAYHIDSIQKENVALDSSGTPLIVEQQSSVPYSQLSHEVQVDNTGDSGNNAGHEVPTGQPENWVSDIILADQIQVKSTGPVDNKDQYHCGSSHPECRVSDVQPFDQTQAETTSIIDRTAAYHVDSIQKKSVALDSCEASLLVDQQSTLRHSQISHEAQVDNTGDSSHNAGHEVPSEQRSNTS